MKQTIQVVDAKTIKIINSEGENVSFEGYKQRLQGEMENATWEKTQAEKRIAELQIKLDILINEIQPIIDVKLKEIEK